MSELKVMSGKFKGKNLKVPKVSRPLTTRIKASIFDTLTPYLDGASVLDLFAGSGSIGIEALSRGAKFATFVEHDKDAIKMIEDNLRHLGAENISEIKNMDYKIFMKKEERTFDLIFMDPPFPFATKVSLSKVKNIMHKESILIFRADSGSHIKFPASIKTIFENKFGESKVFFCRKVAD